MFGFGNSRFKDEARVTVESCVSQARQLDMFIAIGSPQFRLTAARVSDNRCEAWIKLLACAQITQNMLCIMRLNRLGVFNLRDDDLMQTTIYINEYVIAHRFLGLQYSELMIDLVNHTSASENQRAFPKYGWGRWVINVLKGFRNGKTQPKNLCEPLLLDEIEVADKIDFEVTKPMVSQCDLPYRDCVRPHYLPD
jgi:hypothetical protein